MSYTDNKLNQLEHRFRQLQEDYRTQVETVQILRNEIVKLIARMDKMEKAAKP